MLAVPIKCTFHVIYIYIYIQIQGSLLLYKASLASVLSKFSFTFTIEVKLRFTLRLHKAIQTSSSQKESPQFSLRQIFISPIVIYPLVCICNLYHQFTFVTYLCFRHPSVSARLCPHSLYRSLPPFGIRAILARSKVFCKLLKLF